jgi:hypothetical protein
MEDSTATPPAPSSALNGSAAPPAQDESAAPPADAASNAAAAEALIPAAEGTSTAEESTREEMSEAEPASAAAPEDAEANAATGAGDAAGTEKSAKPATGGDAPAVRDLLGPKPKVVSAEPAASAENAPREQRQAIVYLPGLRRDPGVESIEAVAHRVALAMDNNDPAATYSAATGETAILAGDRARKASVVRKGADGKAVGVVDIYEVDYRGPLVDGFAKRPPLVQAWQVFATMGRNARNFVAAVRRPGQSVPQKLQVLYGGLLMSSMLVYMAMLLITAGLTAKKGIFKVAIEARQQANGTATDSARKVVPPVTDSAAPVSGGSAPAPDATETAADEEEDAGPAAATEGDAAPDAPSETPVTSGTAASADAAAPADAAPNAAPQVAGAPGTAVEAQPGGAAAAGAPQQAAGSAAPQTEGGSTPAKGTASPGAAGAANQPAGGAPAPTRPALAGVTGAGAKTTASAPSLIGTTASAKPAKGPTRAEIWLDTAGDALRRMFWPVVDFVSYGGEIVWTLLSRMVGGLWGWVTSVWNGFWTRMHDNLSALQTGVVSVAVLGLVFRFNLKEALARASGTTTCVSNYLAYGLGRPQIVGQMARLLEHLHADEKVDYTSIHLVGYSFGSVVALDCVYQDSRVSPAFNKVTSLTTIGCPADFIRTYWRDYFIGRYAPEGGLPWLNVYAPADVLASNFKDGTGWLACDAHEGFGVADGPTARGVLLHPTLTSDLFRSEVAGHPGKEHVVPSDYEEFGPRAPVGFTNWMWFILAGGGFKAHACYWTDGLTNAKTCWELIIPKLDTYAKVGRPAPPVPAPTPNPFKAPGEPEAVRAEAPEEPKEALAGSVA